MNRDDIRQLLEKYEKHLCSPEESRLIEHLLDRMAVGMHGNVDHIDLDQIGEDILHGIEAKCEQDAPFGKRKHARSVWFAVASVLLLFGLALFMNDRVERPFFEAKPIKPAGNKARITLSNGKEVALKGNDSIIVIQHGDAQYLNGESVAKAIKQDFRLETPKGGIYQLLLEDGTHVWLNAASAISYRADFAEERVVELEGEAYFQVAKGKNGSAILPKPFSVRVGGQLITVLGTSFNVSAYTGDSTIQTTLASGKVRVSALKNKNASIELKPSERAVYQDGIFQVETVDLDEELDWMNKKFVFNNEPLYSIMRRIARWYDLEVEYKQVDRNQRFGGTVSCFEDVVAVLEKLELTKKVHFKLEGRRVVVMP